MNVSIIDTGLKIVKASKVTNGLKTIDLATTNDNILFDNISSNLEPIYINTIDGTNNFDVDVRKLEGKTLNNFTINHL